ncbi:uncharacterized protein BO95DRAFT_488829 [Aspergillus brunneoviolaceus CBS 621.78]|uniref:Uncharacterized protein n=1 Tax=Aspergillus brunneoviolaceus CBS 621.78 TaxID=1450534 RepID=A0ACD1FSG7_9EURO|nr:hypothetical protein BO95DRAFT_488829 [Aspergillus brunneoviolaceus CBS 621.78]RAH39943.1 hypothetical protein BO95DRAFT_488829 [Aspergillus brunneoviolaceus CBS 621.78]
MAKTNVAPSQLPDHTPLMLYVRRCVIRAIGLDDYLVLLALVMVLAFAALSLILTRYAIGYHQNTVPAANMIIMAKPDRVHYAHLPHAKDPPHWTDDNGTDGHCDRVRRAAFDPAVLARPRHMGQNAPGLPMLLRCRAGEPPALPSHPDAPVRPDDHQPPDANNLEAADVYPAPSITGLVACAAGLARIPLLGFQDNSTDYTYVGAVPLILMNLEYALGLITGSLPSLRVLVRFMPGLNSSKRSTYPTQEWELSEPAECRLGGRPRGMHRLRGGDAKNIESESQQHILEVQGSPRPPQTADCG